MTLLHASDVPATAIRAFELIHDLRVTIHDVRGSLWPLLEPERFQHGQPPCAATKSLGHESACFACDVEQTRRTLASHPAGALKVCHARLLEWVVPVFHDESLQWVLFAGVRRPPHDVAQWSEKAGAALLVSNAPPVAGDVRDAFEVPPIAGESAMTVMEHLRQLAARLRLWEIETHVEASETGRRSPPSSALTARQVVVSRFIAGRHTRNVGLNELAAHLNLSPSRASHAVRECCGASWQELLAEARLRTAMGLLRHTSLSVDEVALRSGFCDVRQLQRAFSRRANTTPGRYRRESRA